MLGTRFLATHESNAHPRYKQQLLEAGEKDTVRTILFGHGWPNAPHRTLRTSFVEQWLGNEARAQESRPDEPVIGKTWLSGGEVPIQRFASIPPSARVTGESAFSRSTMEAHGRAHPRRGRPGHEPGCDRRGSYYRCGLPLFSPPRQKRIPPVEPRRARRDGRPDLRAADTGGMLIRCISGGCSKTSLIPRRGARLHYPAVASGLEAARICVSLPQPPPNAL